MRIKLQSNGTAQAKPNYVTTNITISIKDVDKNRCSKLLIDIIGNLSVKLEEFQLKKIEFSSYNIREITKTVEINNKKTNIVEKKSVFDYYNGNAYFNVEFNLDFKLMEQINNLCSIMSKDFTTEQSTVSIFAQFNYTLTDELFAELNSQAVNNALDKMKSQAENIAQHLKLANIELLEVNFVERSFNDNNLFMTEKRAAFGSSNNYASYTIASLDELIKLKDIKVSTEIYSNWELN